MKTSAKLIIIISCLVIIGVAVGTTLGVTFAKWKDTASETKDIDVDIQDVNPSEKYLIFCGLNSSGDFTSLSSEIVEYAVVGYMSAGMVWEVKIPEEHNGKNVTKILIKDGETDTFQKSIIKSIDIPSTINEIGAGVFQFINTLESVTIEGSDTPLVIGDFAFASCENLSYFNNSRAETFGNMSLYLANTKIYV